LRALEAELGVLSTKAASITKDLPVIGAAAATEPASLATEPAVPVTTDGEAAAEARTALDAAVFVLVGSCLLALTSDHLDVAQQLSQLGGAVPYVDALVFAVLIDVVELS